MSHFLFEMWLNINTRKQYQTEGNEMNKEIANALRKAGFKAQKQMLGGYIVHTADATRVGYWSLGATEAQIQMMVDEMATALTAAGYIVKPSTLFAGDKRVVVELAA
jgi:hypothetical protein